MLLDRGTGFGGGERLGQHLDDHPTGRSCHARMGNWAVTASDARPTLMDYIVVGHGRPKPTLACNSLGLGHPQPSPRTS